MDLSHNKLFEVLSKNLRTSECLIYVYQLNAKNGNDEIEFICGNQDLLQWQVKLAFYYFYFSHKSDFTVKAGVKIC